MSRYVAPYGISVTAFPPPKAIAARYNAVAAAEMDLRPAMVDALRYMENAEKRHFELMHGRYVLTGATKASLTQREAFGAIRHAGRQEARFGTNVWWAHFLTKSPYDASYFQVRKHDGHLSAVLVNPPATKGAITRRVMRHLTEAWDGTGF